MTPLTVITEDTFGNDRLAAQVIARPDQTPAPAIESWPYLLQPKAIHLRLSKSVCGASCKGCEIHSVRAGNREPEPEFSVAAWNRVRDHWLPDLTGLEVSGLGEPTVAKIFPQIARETLALGKVLYFPTHGKHLGEKFVTDALGDGTNCRVSISMDAHDDASYVACGRGKKGEWAKMLASVKAFKTACPNAILHSQFTGFSYTIDSLPGWMQVCADLGIKETIFRLGMAVGEIAREDTSLRFMKDKTEAMIYAAQVIAEQNAISFEVERRPYSDLQPNGLDAVLTPEKDSPVNRLKRYLDIAPMSVVVCFGKTTTISDGKTCTTIFGSTYTYNQDAVNSQCTWSDTFICGTQQCIRTTTRVWSGTFGYVPIIVDPCPGFGGMSSGEAETVRSVIIPRGTPIEAMSTSGFQPISLVDSSPVVWADGSISSCFAKHLIGNIYTDTMPTLVRNSWYQNFLQTRDGANGGVMNNEACANCPRNL